MWRWRWGAWADLRARGGPAISGRSRAESPLTNRTALVLGIVLLLVLATDLALYGAEHLVFLGKRLMDLIEWMAFWR